MISSKDFSRTSDIFDEVSVIISVYFAHTADHVSRADMELTYNIELN